MSRALNEARSGFPKEAAAVVTAQRTEEKGRLALLFVLYRADRVRKGSRSFLGDSGLADLLGSSGCS